MLSLLKEGLGWNTDLIDVTVLHVHSQVIHCSVSSKCTSFRCFCFIVYGLHTVDTRKGLWRTLRTFNVQADPWIIAGDFPSILDSEDRLNGAPVTTHETQDFVDCVMDLGLSELKSVGSFYSWTNKGQGEARVASRIDRGIANGHWILSYPNVVTQYLSPGLSDHSPMLFECCAHTEVDLSTFSMSQQPMKGSLSLWLKLGTLPLEGWGEPPAMCLDKIESC